MNTPLTDPVLRRVAAANPVAATELTDAETIRSEALLARIEATPRGAATSGARARRLPGTLKTRIAAAAGTVLAVAGVAIFAPTSASADVVLLQAADAAALQPQATGEYWYVLQQITTLDTAGIAFRREDWTSRERGIMRDEFPAALKAASLGAATVDPADVRIEDLGVGEDGNRVTPAFGDGHSYTWDELDTLPTDPDALRAELLEQLPESGHGRDWDLWNQATALLSSPASPELRRALWQVLATVDGVRLLGHETDALGREGTAIEAVFDRLGRWVMVLDPTTGAVLETRSLLDDGTPGIVATVVEEGPRDSAPEPQPPLCGLGSVPFVGC